VAIRAKGDALMMATCTSRRRSSRRRRDRRLKLSPQGRDKAQMKLAEQAHRGAHGGVRPASTRTRTASGVKAMIEAR